MFAQHQYDPELEDHYVQSHTEMNKALGLIVKRPLNASDAEFIRILRRQHNEAVSRIIDPTNLASKIGKFYTIYPASTFRFFDMKDVTPVKKRKRRRRSNQVKEENVNEENVKEEEEPLRKKKLLLSDLREMAKERGIPAPYSYNRDELLDLLYPPLVKEEPFSYQGVPITCLRKLLKLGENDTRTLEELLSLLPKKPLSKFKIQPLKMIAKSLGVKGISTKTTNELAESIRSKLIQ